MYMQYCMNASIQTPKQFAILGYLPSIKQSNTSNQKRVDMFVVFQTHLMSFSS